MTVEIVNCVVAALPAGVTVDGENEHVAPPGRPEHENDTALLNPFVGVIVRLVEADCPFVTVSACEAAAIEKFAPVGCVCTDRNSPKQAVAFVYQTSRKIKRIFRACLTRRIEDKLPERTVDEALPFESFSVPEKIARCRIERVDRSVAEIADEKII